MTTGQRSGVLQHLRRTMLLWDGAERTDGQLLEDYISHRDEAALATLVQRHGPMVWGVCRRVLGDHHDAEDAFQVTFLVLVRRAAAIAAPELLANWLYGVAHQTAMKARATLAKRALRERQVTEMPEPAVMEQDLWDDLQILLDQELSRLPDIYRTAIVLCDLEGKTRKEAARHLGLPEGTVGSRLARARVLLAKRLTRRGVALSGGALAAVTSQNVASAGVPISVVSSTISAASLFAAGQTSAGVISLKVAALTNGVLKAMLMSKLKSVTVVMLAMVGIIGLATTSLGHRLLATDGASATTTGEPKRPFAQKEGRKAKTQKDEAAIPLPGSTKQELATVAPHIFIRAEPPKVEYKQPFDLPSGEEIMNALPKGLSLAPNSGIKCELVSYRLEAPRFYPNVGPAQLSAAHFKCTVKSDKGNEMVVFIDQTKLIPSK